MEIRRGIPVSPGVAIGPAFVLDGERFRVPIMSQAESSVDLEIGRLEAALADARRELVENQRLVSQKLGIEPAAIFAAHAQVIEDPKLRKEIVEQIRNGLYTAEYAVSHTLRRYAEFFEKLPDPYLSARAADFIDIERRIIRNLLGQRREELAHLRHQVIVLGHDLTPSETANLDRSMVLGLATELGGRTSHTAILAGALELPAVVGIGPFLHDLRDDETVIIDGNEGIVVFDPDPETLAHYRLAGQEFRDFAASLDKLHDLPAETSDGVQISLMGNIEFPSEVEHCIERGAEGIGLYRTEFLYLGSEIEPDEETHYQAYSRVLRDMDGRPVVIRTFDLGADKLTARMEEAREERNPFLGLRSIRLCLRSKRLFLTQLRALLRASVLGDLRVMFPMIATLMELREAKMALNDAMEELDEEDIPFNRDVPVGMMIEVPSAAMMAPYFAKEVDFFSIGTNDLVQYTLAVDRTNRNVAHLFTPSEPAVLRLIRSVVQAANEAKISVNLCGEMSREPIYTPLLLGLGLRRLSVTPQSIPEIKNVIRHIRLEEAEQVARRALEIETARDVTSYLHDVAKRMMPEPVR